MRLLTSTVLSLFLILAITSWGISQDIKFETADGKYQIVGRVAYFLLNGKPVESPKGNEDGLAIVIIRPDGSATRPVAINLLSDKTRETLFSVPEPPSWLGQSLLAYYSLDKLELKNSIAGNESTWRDSERVKGKWVKSFNEIPLHQTQFDRWGDKEGAATGVFFVDDATRYGLETFTVSIWFKWINNSPTDQYRVLIARAGKEQLGQCNYMLRIQNDTGNGGVLEGVVTGEGEVVVGSHEIKVTDAKWHHAALVCDSGNSIIKLFVDGKKVDEKPLVGKITVVPGLHTSVGYWRGENWLYGIFNGSYDDIRIYGNALAEEEVEELYEYESKVKPVPSVINDVTPGGPANGATDSNARESAADALVDKPSNAASSESTASAEAGELPSDNPTKRSSEGVLIESLNILQILDSSPELMVLGWSRDASGVYKANKHANNNWLTIPLPDLGTIEEYKANFALHNSGRLTGKPVFLVHLPVKGGGLFELRFYYGRSISLSVQPSDSIEYKDGSLPITSGALRNGANDVEVTVDKDRVSLALNGQSIGEFEKPKTKPGAEISPPVVKVLAISGSWMEFSLHKFEISPLQR